MSYREELQERPVGEPTDPAMNGAPTGVPAGARQNVRSESAPGVAAWPVGAAQQSGGARQSNAERQGRTLD